MYWLRIRIEAKRTGPDQKNLSKTRLKRCCQARAIVSPLKGYLGLSVVLVDGGLDVADQIDQGVNHGILGNKIIG